jgi:Exopolysaccharide biosynthesis protein related to N-acetylglucosamine-1-phosphodiester alpha-N-acetylglucosaminidase
MNTIRFIPGLLALASVTLHAAPVPAGFTEVANETLGPGVTYQKLQRTGASPLVVYVTEADLNDSRVKVRGVTANDVIASGRKSVQALAKQQASKGPGAVVAAVNGDYFDFDTGATTSASVQDGVPVAGAKSTAIRSTFALASDRTVSFGVNYVSGGTIRSLKTNATHDLHGVNTGRALDQFILYTPYYGSTVVSAATPHVDVREALLKPVGPVVVNAPSTFEVVSIIPGGNPIDVPAGHYVLSASRGLKAWFEANINEVGQQLEITVNLSSETKPVVELIGGGPRLLTNGSYSYANNFDGAENVSHAFQSAARTAVGVTPANKLLLVVVDSNPGVSSGATLTQLADLMLALGATNALNLDGGGSSTMVAGTNYALRNVPSDGSQRLVANALTIETEVPLADRVASLDVAPTYVELPLDGSQQMQALATDHSGVTFPIPASSVSWSVGGVGSVSSDGLVSSIASGYGVLQVSGFGQTAGALVATDTQVAPWGWRVAAPGTGDWSWLSDTNSYARGLALGIIEGEPKLAVFNRNSNSILTSIVENSPLTAISRGNVTGGTYALNDVEISDDGVIFGANLTTNASTNTANTGPFRVYQWSDGAENGATRIVNYSGGAYRMGDKITVVGSVAARTATLYAAAASGTTTATTVARWVINPDGSWPANPTLVTLSGITNAGGQVDIAPVAPGADADFWVNGNGYPATLHSSTGELLATMPTSIIPINSNAISHLEFGGRKYLGVYLQGVGFENARIVDITDGVANATIVRTTAPLGANANTAGISGDVDWVVRPDNTEAILAVLGTNNGIELTALANPALYKPTVAIAPATTATIAAPYSEAAFLVASSDPFATAQTISVTASGVEGVTVPSVTLPAGKQFARLPISGAPAAGAGVVTLTGTLGANSAWVVAAPGTAELTLDASAAVDPFDAWLSSEFSPSELADESISGPAADPFGTGLGNLVRYALGLTKDSSAAQVQSVRPVVATSGNFLKISYLRPVGGQDGVTYKIEGSNDLANWSAVVASETVTPAGSGFEKVEVTDTVSLSSTARRFLRLVVERD